MKKIVRRIVLAAWLMVIFCGITFTFWRNEWKYNLPTPVPADYQLVQTGAFIKLPLSGSFKKGKPLFLHFFNPSCPCSRFNMPHFKSLVKKYGDKFEFAIVLFNTTGKWNQQAIQEKYDIDIPVLSDDGFAKSCGVYSTPQAVIIDAEQYLFYRGNYNKSRYCIDEKSSFARMAVDSFLSNKKLAVSDSEAVKSYGCQLPVCKK